MADYFVVCGGDLLEQYRRVEDDSDDGQFALVRQKDLRRRFLFAKRAPSGILNLSAFAYVVHCMTMGRFGITRIRSIKWKSSVYPQLFHSHRYCILTDFIRILHTLSTRFRDDFSKAQSTTRWRRRRANPDPPTPTSTPTVICRTLWMGRISKTLYAG